MNPVVLYLLKVNVLLIVCWFFYRLFLQKETFYNTIRWYFISSVLLAFVLPLITYTKTVIIEQTPVFNDLNWENTILPETMALQPEPAFWETINWQSVVLYILLAVSICCVVKSVYQILKLYISINKLPILNNSQIKITDNQQNIYSFYQWIVVPENKLSAANLEMILAHEKIHLNQKHTFDLIFIELVSAVFWFNPLIKKLQKDINTNLEFIVDEKMIDLYEPVLYQKSLLNEHCNYTLKYINAFNTSDLKKRIIQLNTQKSKNMKKLKFLVAAPVLVIFFALFQIETVAQIKTIEVQEVSENDEKEDSFYIQIHSKYDDAYYERTAKMLKEKYNLDVKFYNLKRNKNGELTDIKVSYKNDYPAIVGRYSFDSDKPIEPYKLHVYNDDSGKYYIEQISTEVEHVDIVFGEDDQLSFNAEALRTDRKVFNKVIKKHPIIVDNIPLTKKQLKQFDNSKIKSMSLKPDETGKNKPATLLLSTKKESLTFKSNPSKYSVVMPNNKEYRLNSTTFINGEPVKHKIVMGSYNDDGTEVSKTYTLDFTSSDTSQNVVYVIDGKEVSDKSMKTLNPNDIENITILKDQKAIEKYGAKDKDGVIIVTTKSKKEVSLQQKREALKARKLAVKEKRELIEKQRQELLVKREDLLKKSEQRRKELTSKKDEMQENAERRKKEIEKLRQEQEKLRKNHKYVTVSNKGDSKLLEKDYETVNTIFKDLKEIKKIEDENIKITSISASITREDGTKIEITEKY